MPDFTDIAKALVNPTFTYMYDLGMHHICNQLSPQFIILSDGGELEYTPYAGTNLAFYLNRLYRQSPGNFTENFKEFLNMVCRTWREMSDMEITIQLEIWVITEMERNKLRILESQYERVIREAVEDSRRAV